MEDGRSKQAKAVGPARKRRKRRGVCESLIDDVKLTLETKTERADPFGAEAAALKATPFPDTMPASWWVAATAALTRAEAYVAAAITADMLAVRDPFLDLVTGAQHRSAPAHAHDHAAVRSSPKTILHTRSPPSSSPNPIAAHEDANREEDEAEYRHYFSKQQHKQQQQTPAKQGGTRDKRNAKDDKEGNDDEDSEVARRMAHGMLISRAESGRLALMEPFCDGRTYMWPACVIDASCIERADSVALRGGVMFFVHPLNPACTVPVVLPSRYPFWANTLERRAQWAASVVNQRMLASGLPKRSLDHCERCGQSIVDGHLRTFGPPSNFESGDAEWQRTARACFYTRYLLDRLDPRCASGKRREARQPMSNNNSNGDGDRQRQYGHFGMMCDIDHETLVHLACNAQRMLELVIELTGGRCTSPTCLGIRATRSAC